MTNKSRIVDYDNIYIWVHVNLGTQFTVAIQWSNYHKYTLPLKLDTVLISGVHSWVLPLLTALRVMQGSCIPWVLPPALRTHGLEWFSYPLSIYPFSQDSGSGHSSCIPWVLPPPHRTQGQGMIPASPEYCPLPTGLRVKACFLFPLSIAPYPQDTLSEMVPLSPEFCFLFIPSYSVK